MNHIIKNLPEEQRPYEKCFKQGENTLSDSGAAGSDPAKWYPGEEFSGTGTGDFTFYGRFRLLQGWQD